MDTPLAIAAGGTLTISGVIDDAGHGYGIVMTNSGPAGGVLDLEGINTFTGPSGLAAGTFEVEGAIAGDLDTAAGSIVGSGTFGSVRVEPPTGPSDSISPGPIGGTGIMTISGPDFVLAPNAILDIDLDGPNPGTGYDQILDTTDDGGAVLQGTLNVNVGPASSRASARHSRSSGEPAPSSASPVSSTAFNPATPSRPDRPPSRSTIRTIRRSP